MRLQLALNVQDLDAAIAFYSAAFGVGVHKREPGYANFVVDEPALKLVLFENADAAERLNHLGVEVFEDDQVMQAADRLAEHGVASDHDADQICCYARQNKVQTTDPDGTMWEWYRVLEDLPARRTPSACAEVSCC
jgi:catechol 2,3-dioxygenase-like lactoylglutathione lyase family enzyme